MAKSSLREFQEAILSKLKEATTQGATTSSSRLGVMLGDRRLLIDLRDIVEVLPVPAYQVVPFTQPWFLGVTNVRGVLYNLTDLAQFMRLPGLAKTVHNRILLLSSQNTTQTALLVTSLIGLRNTSDMQMKQDVENDDFVRQVYIDAEQNEWIELDVEALVENEVFIQPTV